MLLRCFRTDLSLEAQITIKEQGAKDFMTQVQVQDGQAKMVLQLRVRTMKTDKNYRKLIKKSNQSVKQSESKSKKRL